MVALQISPRVCMDWVDQPQNYKGLYGIVQLLQGSHLDNFPPKTRKLAQVAFHSLTFQLKCLDFQSDHYKKLAQCSHVSAMATVIHYTQFVRGDC